MYLDDQFWKILTYNQVFDGHIMSRIGAVGKEVEEGREKIKEEVKAEEKESKAMVMAEMITLQRAIEHRRSSPFVFNIDPTVVAPTPDPYATDLP